MNSRLDPRRWTYRMVRVSCAIDTWIDLYEVHVDDAGQPLWRHPHPATAYGDSPTEIRAVLAKMLEATTKPILDDSEFPRRHA